MIDESAARFNGAITVLVLAVAVATPYHWVLGYLVLDFAIKVFAGFAYSPSCKLAAALANAMHLQRKMVDSAPKRLAAIIALFMSLTGLALAAFAPTASLAFLAITGIFLVFASLEAFAGFCMGCWIYALLPSKAAILLSRRVN